MSVVRWEGGVYSTSEDDVRDYEPLKEMCEYVFGPPPPALITLNEFEELRTFSEVCRYCGASVERTYDLNNPSVMTHIEEDRSAPCTECPNK